jgi:hypothetical protein
MMREAAESRIRVEEAIKKENINNLMHNEVVDDSEGNKAKVKELSKVSVAPIPIKRPLGVRK